MRISTATTFAHALLLAAASFVTAAPEPDYQIDTSNMAPRLFDPPTDRKTGYSFADEMSIQVTAEVETSGMALKMSFDATGDSDMKVEDRGGALGGRKVEVTIQNIKANLQSFLMTLHCDSNDRTHSDPDCEEIFPIVGQTETIELDENGQLVSVTTFDGQTFDMAQITEQANAMTMDSKWQANQFAASTHVDKTSQMFKLIPDHAVRPGDSWIDDIDMGNMGTFKGNSYFKGYTTYKGSNCAVFYFDGNLHLDITNLAKAVGADPSTLPQNMADAHITNVIFWDVQDEISRWAQANITTALDISNPMNPSDDTPMHVPVELVLSLDTDITARPDHEASAGASESYMAPPAATTTSSSSSSSYSLGTPQQQDTKSGKSHVGGIVFALMAGLAAAAGLFVYHKRRQQMIDGDVFVRPTYEFSPVGSEPMMAVTGPMV